MAHADCRNQDDRADRDSHENSRAAALRPEI